MNSNDQWFYLDGQVRRGPFSHDALLQLLHAGVINPDTLVHRDGDQHWTSAGAAMAPSNKAAATTPRPTRPPATTKRFENVKTPTKSDNNVLAGIGWTVALIAVLAFAIGMYTLNPTLIIPALAIGVFRWLFRSKN